MRYLANHQRYCSPLPQAFPFEFFRSLRNVGRVKVYIHQLKLMTKKKENFQ